MTKLSRPFGPLVRLRIGVSGHRAPPKLPVAAQVPLRATVGRVLTATVAAANDVEHEFNARWPQGGRAAASQPSGMPAAPANFVVISSLAEGADRIVAESGLAAGFALEAVLPFARAEYARDFHTPESRGAFDRLLGTAASVVELDGPADVRPRAYEAAGLVMLANVDLLIAIWDGRSAEGFGGTGDIVSRAIADGIPVVWIDPAAPERLQLCCSRADEVPPAHAGAQPKDTFRAADEARIGECIAEILRRRSRQAPHPALVMTDTTSSIAESQCDRDRHLFAPGPKHILALDGGGVRGAITVAFLERIEALLSERYGKDVRLGDHFDLIGGTSTGAIIAGALALGRRTDEVKDFYLRLTPYAFKRQRWHIPLLQTKFDARGLRKQIVDVVGDRVLSTTDLITGFRDRRQAYRHRQPVDHLERPARAVLGRRAGPYRQQELPPGQSGAGEYCCTTFLRSGVASDQPERGAP